MYGDQGSLPVYRINSTDQLELNFDDLDANAKSYNYSFQLCDYNWNPIDISPLLYTKGFTQQRIGTYRYSSIALTRYTHWSVMVPDRNTTLTMSGNYILKVYLDGDTSKLAYQAHAGIGSKSSYRRTDHTNHSRHRSFIKHIKRYSSTPI